MNKYEKDQLINLLTKWFEQIDFEKTNVFNKDRVAKLLKNKLIELNKWIDRRAESEIKTNNIDNIKKGITKRLELENKLIEIQKNIPKCKCGADIEVVEHKNGKVVFMCSDMLNCKFT